MRIEDQKINIDGSFPKGEDFVRWVFSIDQQKEHATLQFLKDDIEFNSLETFLIIPEYLKILYNVSTCAYGCRGGSHVIEYITGRGYNLAISSLKLLRIGFYDEAWSLIRSISEIVNLFALFGLDRSLLINWYEMSEKERMKEFSPSAVRKKIIEKQFPLPITKEYYSKLCEISVHVNPKTIPQGRNHINKPLVGGFVTKESAIAVLNDLANNIAWLAIVALRNSVKKEIFMKEIELLKPLYAKIGKLNIETLEEYLKAKSNAS